MKRRASCLSDALPEILIGSARRKINFGIAGDVEAGDVEMPDDSQDGEICEGADGLGCTGQIARL